MTASPDAARRAGASSRAATAVSPRRKPWWVLMAGVASLLGWSGWVAAQPLPPSNTSPQVQAVNRSVQQGEAALQSLSAQASQWQAQRAQAAAALQAAENALGGGGAAASAGVPSSPATPSFAVTRGS